jgi:pyruvate formate lyase activating enzyme
MKALVNKIILPSLVDGPGSRAAIFLQGCNLQCLYCHNPETQNLCSNCGECVLNCSTGALLYKNGCVIFDEKCCIDCQACIKSCKINSSPKVRSYTTDALLAAILPYQSFIEGVTFSGGECTLQHEFLIAFGKLLHQKTDLTMLLDTNGLVDGTILAEIIAHSNGLMIDLKAFNPHNHLKLTKALNASIIDNIRLVAGAEKLAELRLTLIEDFNDDPAELRQYFDFVASLPGQFRLKLIPFSPFGVKGELADMLPYPQDHYDAAVVLGQSILKDRIIKVCYNWRKKYD